MQKKIIEFVTVSHSNTMGLSVEVNEYLKQGWTLSGTMQTTGEDGSTIIGGSHVTYSQALVLYEGDLIPLTEKDKQDFQELREKYNSGCMIYIIIGLTALWYLL